MSKETHDMQSTTGRGYWRSLDELVQSSEFRERMEREFPREAAELRDPVSRRAFLKLMGASMALSSLVGCQFAIKQPQEKIVPYVRQPEQVIPGRALYFATSMAVQGYGIGLLAESHEGRPTKVEGNPDHPASLGGSDAWIQASVLTMYDPDRSQGITNGGQTATWADASAALASAAAGAGAGLRILSEPSTSPTLAAQVASLGAKWYQYHALSADNTSTGTASAVGAGVEAVYAFEQADVVVALDSDFTTGDAMSLRYARDLANKRRVWNDAPSMNRLYVAEPTPTATGTMADHRLAIKAGEIGAVAQAIAAAVGVAGVSAPSLSEDAGKWVTVAAADLKGASGKSVVIAGESQSAEVHALAHAINAALGNVGTTVKYQEAVGAARTGVAVLKELVAEIESGAVSMLVISDANVVYNAPGDLNLAEALKKVATVVHHGLYVDETAAVAGWHINGAHYLESWGDLRAFDGTVSLQQPLIAPLYDGKSLIEVVAALSGDTRSAHDIVKAYWQSVQGTEGYAFDKNWQIALHDGVVANTQAASATGTPSGAVPSIAAPGAGLEIVFRPDPSLRDGSAANNGWLQEVPKPVTKMTWDNTAQVSPHTAEQLGLKTGDIVSLTFQGRSVDAPVYVVAGQADETVVVHLGFGRTKAGRVGDNVGFNAYTLRSSDAMWHGSGVEVKKIGSDYKLASTQMHFSMEGRDEDIYRRKTLDELLHPEKHAGAHHGHHEIISLFPEYDYSKGYQWGMSIDLTVCNGCNACVVACQAENNIPVVGKEQVWMGREMHWIRIDTYFSGDLSHPEIYQQPVACMQCEHAPCEIVCPVAATVHDSEGLNNMVYNRCVGTKYCSNNCPYKVRRFNFFQYVDEETPSLKLQRNPDVTVRARGVMEKCNYCQQRINEARIDARRQGRDIADGEVVTACQQACPTQAIVFGNINDKESKVAKLKELETKFTMLDPLNTKPRTSYLVKLTNPNPELAGEHGVA
jgi:molybdopterin-containing oxidoreductase family iron-sulfur binding subunit